MNRKITIAILGALISLPAMAQKQWTLNDCIGYAKEHNLQIKQSRNSLESAEVDVKRAKAALFPSLTFSTQQSVGIQKVEFQSYGSFDSKATSTTYTGSYGLQGNVTVFNGGTNWLSIKKSKLSQQAQQLDVDKTEHNVMVNIVKAYYQVLYAHESVLVDEEIVKVSEKELERTKALHSVGKGNKVDVAQMESQLQQNRYTLTQAINAEAENILTLKKILQLDPSAEFTVDYHQFGEDEVLAVTPSLAEIEEMAIAYLPDMKAAELNVKAAEMQVKMEKGGYLPTVSLNAGVTTSNGNTLTGGFGSQLRDHLRGTAGVSVQMPIFDNRGTKSSVEKAKIQHTNSVIEHENTLLELKNTLASLHLDIQSSQSRYKSAVASEEAARQSFEMIDERYAVGLETMLDLLTEKNNYIRAKQETLQSKFNALLNQQLLKCYTGTN